MHFCNNSKVFEKMIDNLSSFVCKVVMAKRVQVLMKISSAHTHFRNVQHPILHTASIMKLLLQFQWCHESAPHQKHSNNLADESSVDRGSVKTLIVELTQVAAVAKVEPLPIFARSCAVQMRWRQPKEAQVFLLRHHCLLGPPCSSCKHNCLVWHFGLHMDFSRPRCPLQS